MKTVFSWVIGVTVWSAAHFLVYLKLFYTSVGGGAGYDDFSTSDF